MPRPFFLYPTHAVVCMAHRHPLGGFPASQETHGRGARRSLYASRTKLSRPWHISPGVRGGNGSPEVRQASTTPTRVERHEVEIREQETPEQAIALAKGGFRRGDVVFHRKGVKLSEESPRSMPPRDVRNARCQREPTMRRVIGIVALKFVTEFPLTLELDRPICQERCQ